MIPEWLTSDPLNGLVITFAFFISLIIGRYLNERRILFEKRKKIIEPRIRLILAFLLIIAVTMMKHWYFPLTISIICIFTAFKIKVFRNYTKYLIFPLLMALFILAVQGFAYFTGMIEQEIIPGRSFGIEYGFLISTRIFASASVLIILILSTSESELIESLRWLRVPATILEISSFMNRYIKTFSYEGKKIILAQRSRLGLSGSFLTQIQDTAMIFGLLITHAFTRSDEIYRAMLSRAWKPELQYSHHLSPLCMTDVVSIVLLVSGLLGIVFLDRSI